MKKAKGKSYMTLARCVIFEKYHAALIDFR